ncbi:MAG TPA: hypothetical protein P5119_09615 [Candidatus Aminicenantes bacterium]|nr:hypothetical protein [Candidatus Aminicenantes bacterium]HRY65580.1 hypothetical protein [Candidatus Aminicenantes bacterium]HRZ72532.1 hypothetical protein [Candidatus Aminicenantes bacterium]
MKMIKASAAFAGLFLLSALAAFPQSGFLKKGQYGFSLTGAYASNSAAHGLSGTVGVGLGGIFDLSFAAGHVTYDDTGEFTELTAASLSPQLTAHVIKQNSSRSPVSVSITVGYARDSFASPDLDLIDYKMWANTLMIGGTVYRDVRLSGAAYLQPYAGLVYSSTSLKISDPSSYTLSADDSLVSLGLGLPVVYALGPKALLVIQPGLTFELEKGGRTTFALSAGLVYIIK